jgi:hypothetical protein
MKTNKKTGLPFQATRLSNFWPVCLTTGLIGPVAFRLPIARDLAFSAAIGYKVPTGSRLICGSGATKSEYKGVASAQFVLCERAIKTLFKSDCRKQLQG